jgi:hypothetical protein
MSRSLGPISLALFMLFLFGCSSSGDIFAPPSGGDANDTSSLVSSESSPATGDATLTDAATLTLDAGGGGYDELKLIQTTGETTHTVRITWDTVTHALQGASHIWGPGQSHGGPTSGFTACFAGSNDCDPGRVIIDLDAKTVTFNQQVLQDILGGSSTSTLNGRLGW